MLVFVLSVFTMIRSILNVSSFRSSVNLNRRLRVIGISPILHFSKKKTSIAELSENAAREELKILNADLNLHDKLYYEEGKPSFSDSAYDKVVLRAENIIGKFPGLNSIRVITESLKDSLTSGLDFFAYALKTGEKASTASSTSKLSSVADVE